MARTVKSQLWEKAGHMTMHVSAWFGRFEASYESSLDESFGNLPSSPLYLSPAFLKVEPSSMNFRC